MNFQSLRLQSPVKPIRHENAIDKVDTKYTESQVI